MEDLTAIVTKYNQNKEDTEGRCWDGEKINADDVFGVIPKECAPCL